MALDSQSKTTPSPQELRQRIIAIAQEIDDLLDSAPKDPNGPWEGRENLGPLAKELEDLQAQLKEEDIDSGVNEDKKAQDGLGATSSGPETNTEPIDSVTENGIDYGSLPQEAPESIKEIWAAYENGLCATAVDNLMRLLLADPNKSDLAHTHLDWAVSVRQDPELSKELLIKLSGYQRVTPYAPLERVPSKPTKEEQTKTEKRVEIALFQGYPVARVKTASNEIQAFAKLPNPQNSSGNWVPFDGITVVWRKNQKDPQLVRNWDVSRFQGGGLEDPLYPYGTKELKDIGEELDKNYSKSPSPEAPNLKDYTQLHNWISEDLNHPAQINELACQEMEELGKSAYKEEGMRVAQDLGAGRIQGNLGSLVCDIIKNSKEMAILSLELFRSGRLATQAKKRLAPKESLKILESLDQYNQIRQEKILETGGAVGKILGEILIRALTKLEKSVTRNGGSIKREVGPDIER